MKLNEKALTLYAVTDRTWLNGRALSCDVEKALKGGATMIQLREKELSDDAFLKEAIIIKKLCEQYKIPFIINDNVDLAVAVDADGIHIGQSDENAGNVRKKIGEDKILGVSVQTVEQAITAMQDGANYLGVGAIFSTGTKKDADVVSLKTLQEICKSVSIPVCAIGGIYDYNIEKLSGTGIKGAALVSAVFAAENIKEETKKLLLLSKKMVAS